MRIICINGYRGSGKSETGQAIHDVLYDNLQTTRVIGFADKIKVAACRALGFSDLPEPDCVVYMDQFKLDGWIEFGQDGSLIEREISGREFLQWLGSEMGRDLFGDTFWIDQVLPKPDWNNPGNTRMALDAKYPGVDCLAIIDCRFPNEAQRCLDLGGEVWEVIRPGTGGDEHSSEKPLPRELVTRLIVNDGSLTQLRYNVEKALA